MFNFFKEILFGASKEVSQIKDLNESTWEVLNTTEDERRETIKRELDEIKNSQTMNNLKYIISCVCDLYSTISEEVKTNVENSSLSLSSKESIFFHFVNSHHNEWLKRIIDEIFNVIQEKDKEQEFIMKWERGKYQKNICGEIIAGCHMIFLNSSSGLNVGVLKDITWKYYVLISSQLTQVLNRRLSEHESASIILIFVPSLEIFIGDWNRYVLISGDINERLNVLPKKWEIMEKDKTKTIRLRIQLEDKPQVVEEHSFKQNKDRIHEFFKK
jgi:hypothetical protein